MSTHKLAIAIFAVVMPLSVAVSSSSAEDLSIDLGQPVTEAELPPWSITIFPDGRNLPPGQGTAQEGEKLYRGRCATCHGETGTEGPASRLAGSDGFFSLSDPLRVIRIQKHPLLVMSVGAQWPFATSIFDYVRRAMPHPAPKSLTHNEVYAVTAFILHLNDLIGEGEVLGRKKLPRVKMPGHSRSVDVSTQPLRTRSAP